MERRNIIKCCNKKLSPIFFHVALRKVKGLVHLFIGAIFFFFFLKKKPWNNGDMNHTRKSILKSRFSIGL